MKIISPNKKSFIYNLYKAYTEGVYADTPQNRKLGRVGMTYSQYAKKKYNEDEGGDKERQHDKKYYQEEIKKLAEKAYKSGKKAIPFSDEDTRNLVKKAEEEWGLNFSSDICEIWTNTYHKLLFADMVKTSKEKKENGSSSINEELWMENIFKESDLFNKEYIQGPKWKITFIPSGANLKNKGKFSLIEKDGDLIGGYDNDTHNLYFKKEYQVVSKKRDDGKIIYQIEKK